MIRTCTEGGGGGLQPYFTLTRGPRSGLRYYLGLNFAFAWPFILSGLTNLSLSEVLDYTHYASRLFQSPPLFFPLDRSDWGQTICTRFQSNRAKPHTRNLCFTGGLFYCPLA